MSAQPSGCQTTQLIANHQKGRLPLLIFGILTGSLTGTVVCLYRLAVEKALELARFVYHSIVTQNPLFLLPWMALLALLAMAVAALMRWEPLSKGSGIPQIEGELRGQIDMVWWRVLLSKFVGGVLCMAAGFALGREGPSIQLGAAAAKGIRKLCRRPESEEKYLMTGGASAGLAAAFNAPLSGVVFALEEVHGHFSADVLLTAMACAISSDVVSKVVFGASTVFDFQAMPVLPIKLLPFLALLGMLLGAAGALFNSSILATQRAYSRIAEKHRMFIPFAVCIVVGCLLPAALGGGNSVISSLSSADQNYIQLLVLLAVRFALTMVCFGSGAPGGIFLPLLTVGALMGALFGLALSGIFGLGLPFVLTFSALAMAGYFAAVVRAPVTGILLITEMTGSFSHLLSLSAIVLVAYLTAQLLGSEPIYESLLNRLLNLRPAVECQEHKKVILEEVVHLDSALDTRRIGDISWPGNCLVVGVRRGSREIIPNGDTVLYSGDMLILITDAGREGAARKKLQRLATKPARYNV